MTTCWIRRLCRAVGAFLLVAASGPMRAAGAPDFNRDIRPILSDTCFACHGPDDAKRKGGLRLDLFESARKGGKSGHPAVVPGMLDASELVRRIQSTDPDEVMPPPDSGRRITPAQVDLLKRWVAAGGRYAQHWAFVAPESKLGLLPSSKLLTHSRTAL